MNNLNYILNYKDFEEYKMKMNNIINIGFYQMS